MCIKCVNDHPGVCDSDSWDKGGSLQLLIKGE